MEPHQILRDGNLAQALAAVQNQAKGDPSNAKHRVYLFQLLAVLGQWDRALTQLNVAGDLATGNLAMVHAYRQAIQCEVLRAEVFQGKRLPLVLGKPPDWLALLMEALRVSAAGAEPKAQSLREEAFDGAPTTAGTLRCAEEPAGDSLGGAGSEPPELEFAWIADADSRLGPLLEVLVKGHYYWVPFHRIREIRLDAPVDLRDVVWMPAHFVWANGGTSAGFIPTRYPGSESAADAMLQLARRTEWTELSGDAYRGLGQRMLATDAGEYPIMDLRTITLRVPAEPEEAEGPEPTDG